jgi:hypothetical protein
VNHQENGISTQTLFIPLGIGYRMRWNSKIEGGNALHRTQVIQTAEHIQTQKISHNNMPSTLVGGFMM